MPALLAIDFETSCLPHEGRAFPIEVGLSDLNGHYRSWLIKPDASWKDWGWSDEARELHGLSFDQLWRLGQPAAVVLAELSRAVRNYQVIADSDLDAYWLTTLSATVSRAVPFAIEHVINLLEQIGSTPQEIQAAAAKLEEQHSFQHRAGPKARWLALLIRQLKDAARARLAAKCLRSYPGKR